jgi:hypothetical protein
MDVLPIENQEVKPTKQQVDQAIAAAAQYISAWTQREFSRLNNNNKNLPLIWPLPRGGYQIGMFHITPRLGYWELTTRNQDRIHVFDSKQSAIFYCLCEHVRLGSIAARIQDADTEVLRLKNDVTHYEASLDRARKNSRLDGISIWSARLADARLRLQISQTELNKHILQAKNLKIWQQ